MGAKRMTRKGETVKCTPVENKMKFGWPRSENKKQSTKNLLSSEFIQSFWSHIRFTSMKHERKLSPEVGFLPQIGRVSLLTSFFVQITSKTILSFPRLRVKRKRSNIKGK